MFFKSLVVVFLVLSSSLFSVLSGQDLEKIGKENPLKISGGIGMNAFMYSANGIENRRDPFNYSITGNLKISLFEVTMPLSFTYSNRSLSYGQPNNQIGFSPYYKSVKGHFGYRNLTYSPYTLNGHVFLGGGLEAKIIKRFVVGGMYGRLNKSVEYQPNHSPVYQRFGGAVFLGYEHESTKIKVTAFHAEDKQNSITNIIEADSLGINPMENFAWSISASQTIGGKLKLAVDYGQSILTRDTRAVVDENTQGVFDNTPFLSHRSSTFTNNAYKAKGSYDFGLFTLGGTFEHVDPEFQTLGSYFFNNDLEKYSVDFSTKLFKQRVNLKLNVGEQWNNLNKTELTTMRRLAVSGNISVQASKKITVTASYSDFVSSSNVYQFFQDPNDPADIYDTINYVQISRSAAGSFNWRLKATKKIVKNFLISGSYQTSIDRNLDVPSVEFYNTNLMYLVSLTDQKLNISIGANANFANAGELLNTTNSGLNGSLSKGIRDNKVKLRFSYTLNTQLSENVLLALLHVPKVGVDIKVMKKHMFRLSGSYVYKQALESSVVEFGELISNIGYRYAF